MSDEPSLTVNAAVSSDPYRLTESKDHRDHWRSQAETALRALPAPVAATNSNRQEPEKKPYFGND